MYVTALGLLLAQYTFCGYDASSHLSEETTQAQISAPRGIVRSIWVSWIAGFILLAGLTSAIQDYAGTQSSSTGVPPAQIFLDVLGADGAKALMLIVIVAQLFSGSAETAAASRMVFAFSRDGAIPFAATWRRVSPRTKTPAAAVWLSVGSALVLAAPSLYSPTAYAAVTAINVIGITPGPPWRTRPRGSCGTAPSMPSTPSATSTGTGPHSWPSTTPSSTAPPFGRSHLCGHQPEAGANPRIRSNPYTTSLDAAHGYFAEGTRLTAVATLGGAAYRRYAQQTRRSSPPRAAGGGVMWIFLVLGLLPIVLLLWTFAGQVNQQMDSQFAGEVIALSVHRVTLTTGMRTDYVLTTVGSSPCR
uniref:Amino acid permease/ SLC12A domain-containing protein n=1 Tax=Streptomyces avermitilis TaxID=33903 RepID=A0A499V0C4_STRAX|nr:hypothetical protein SAVMC3_04520 [Streptomyces avermitilis]